MHADVYACYGTRLNKYAVYTRFCFAYFYENLGVLIDLMKLRIVAGEKN